MKKERNKRAEVGNALAEGGPDGGADVSGSSLNGTRRPIPQSRGMLELNVREILDQ